MGIEDEYSPGLFGSVVWVLIIFSCLGIIAFNLLFPKPPQLNQVQQTVQAPPPPSANPKSLPSTAQEAILPPAPPAPSAQDQPGPSVTPASAESQTLRYYKKNQPGMKYLTAEINNIPFEVMLDTGASYIALNSDTVKSLGISSFTRKTTASTAGGIVNAYLFDCDSVKLGSMTINNVICEYVPTLRFNLLGNSFLSHFIYSINDEDETITLIPKDNKTYISNNKIMPVEGEGWAEVNGKKYRYEDGRLKEIPGE